MTGRGRGRTIKKKWIWVGEEEKFRLKRISSDNKIIQIPFLERGLNIYIYIYRIEDRGYNFKSVGYSSLGSRNIGKLFLRKINNY